LNGVGFFIAYTIFVLCTYFPDFAYLAFFLLFVHLFHNIIKVKQFSRIVKMAEGHGRSLSKDNGGEGGKLPHDDFIRGYGGLSPI